VGTIKNIRAKMKKGTMPSHDHDIRLAIDGAAGEGPTVRGDACATRSFES
jgi:hypothetical protein